MQCARGRELVWRWLFERKAGDEEGHDIYWRVFERALKLSAMAQEAHPDSQMPGIAKPVLPMHIYNLCLGRTKLPALVLDIRSAEDFKMFHIVNSFSCPVESPTVHFLDIERTLAAAPAVLQRLQNRHNVAIGVVSNLPPFLQPNLSFIQRIRLVMSFQWPRQWPSCWRVTCRPTTRRAPPPPR